MASFSEFVAEKRISKTALSKNEKIIILNVLNALRHQNSLYGVTKIVEMCSNMTGVGQSTIYKIIQEDKRGPIRSPKRSTGRRRKENVITEEEKSAIRRIVYAFYLNKEIPTLDKIISEMKKDDSIQPMVRNQVWKTLKEMNFRYENKQWIANENDMDKSEDTSTEAEDTLKVKDEPSSDTEFIKEDHDVKIEQDDIEEQYLRNNTNYDVKISEIANEFCLETSNTSSYVNSEHSRQW